MQIKSMKLLSYPASLRSLTSYLFISAVIVSVLFGRSVALVKLPQNVTFPAVLVFGDSIVDTGNNNHLKTLVKCNFRPYGADFKGRIPTGRFCNGRVPSDLLAEELGINDVLPAYLDQTLSLPQLLTGVSFASGGSGYDPLTPKLASVISLPDQLKNFEEYIKKLKFLVGEDRTNFIIANSLVLVVAGSDDIANTYFDLHARRGYDIQNYTDLMVNSASDFVKELHQLGAKRVGVVSAPPIGCVPSQRLLKGGIRRGCAEKSNVAARLFNQKLAATMDSLQKNFTDSKYIYIDIYDTLLDIIQNPQKFEFEEATKGCCGTGNVEAAILCNPMTPTTCKDVTKYVFWDSYHPTEKTYKILLKSIIESYVQKFF